MKQNKIKAWAIKNHRKDGKIMLVSGNLPIFWLKNIAEERNREFYQGEVVEVQIIIKQ
jgi:hypothetical protein